MTMTGVEPTSWGESYGELAEAVLDDRTAPPVLALAAYRAKHGDYQKLRDLVEAAVALDSPPPTEIRSPQLVPEANP